LLAALAAALVTAAVSAAAIPGAGDSIIACYELASPQNGGVNGPLRPVEAASECGKGDAAVTLGRAGIPGPAGPAGPPGGAGLSVRAEDAQIFENVMDGHLPDGRLAALPHDATPFTIAVDVPAGTYIVLANVKLDGLQVLYDRTTGAAVWVQYPATCKLRAGDQVETTTRWVKTDETWTQHLAVTLEAPRTITLACNMPKYEADDPRSFAYMLVKGLRLTAIRLPQTRVSRTVTLAAILTGLPHTRERRPVDPKFIFTTEQKRLTEIAKRLRHK
jgi:hypothetical protein